MRRGSCWQITAGTSANATRASPGSRGPRTRRRRFPARCPRLWGSGVGRRVREQRSRATAAFSVSGSASPLTFRHRNRARQALRSTSRRTSGRTPARVRSKPPDSAHRGANGVPVAIAFTIRTRTKRTSLMATSGSPGSLQRSWRRRIGCARIRAAGSHRRAGSGRRRLHRHRAGSELLRWALKRRPAQVRIGRLSRSHSSGRPVRNRTSPMPRLR